MQLFIKASIEPEVAIKLTQMQDNYTVIVQNERRIDGPLMLFRLIGMVAIETRATVSNITNKLGNLMEIMEEEKSNIKDFNTKVNLLILVLQARNAPVPDILNQLFTAYKACGDSSFAKYITTKEDLYMDGTMNYTRPQLMKVVVKKFKTISNKGEWLKKSEEQLEFIAMKAQLQSQLEKLGSNKKPKLKQNAEKPP
jgi:hypothetical protein